MPPKRGNSVLIEAITVLYSCFLPVFTAFYPFSLLLPVFPWYFLILYANFLFIQFIYVSCILYIDNV